MPIYEYRCTQCGKVSEVLQRMGARPLRTCESCGGGLEKVISRVSFALKGGGWFAEGYTNGKRKGGSAAGDAESKGSASGKDAKDASKAKS